MQYTSPSSSAPGEVDFELQPNAPGIYQFTLQVQGHPSVTRRVLVQMTQLEFVLVFLMGGVIILSTVGKDHSVTNCTCAVLAVGCIHRFVSSLKLRHPKFGELLDGTPLVLVRKGEWQETVMAGMRLAPEDVMASARSKGIGSFDDIEYAILQRNGRISVIKKPQVEDVE